MPIRAAHLSGTVVTLAVAAVTLGGSAVLAQTPAPAEPTQPPATPAATPEPPPPATPAAGAGAGPQSPAFTPVRWSEDWSYLRDQQVTDPLLRIKYIPLARDGDVWLSLGGQARYRYENYSNLNFGAGVQDDDGYHLFRLMAHADLHVGEHLRFFLQGIGAFVEGREGGGRPGVDENHGDVHQAFVDLRLPVADAGALTLRGGRQNLLYGAQRLISPLDWTNARRTFDGGKVSFAYGEAGTSVDVFLVRPVVVDRGPLDEFFEDGVTFAGVYNTLALPSVLPGARTRFEQYVLYLDRDVAPFFQGVGEERRVTVGARFSTTPRPYDLDVEAAYQFGSFDGPQGDGDISAFFVAGEAGYTLPDVTLAPRVFVGGTYASGDGDPADGDLGTFNHLFPLGHAYLGYADVLGRQNVINGYVGTEVTLLADARWAKRVTLQGAYHAFWRASTDDGIYNVAGVPVAGRGLGQSRAIATELDALLNWQFNRHLTSYAGYSHVFAGDYIEETGPAEDIGFFYVALQFTF